MRKALIVWGGWPGHEPEKGARYVERMLVEDGFSVEVTGDYTAFGRPDLHELSLIVPNITSAVVDKAPIDNLVAAVRSGVGFAAFHGSATAFRDMINYHFMMGAQWVQHPGDIIDYRVHVEKPFDPAAVAKDASVVDAKHTELESALLVRTNGRTPPPHWRVNRVSLEELVLAYLVNSQASSLPTPTLAEHTK